MIPNTRSQPVFDILRDKAPRLAQILGDNANEFGNEILDRYDRNLRKYLIWEGKPNQPCMETFEAKLVELNAGVELFHNLATYPHLYTARHEINKDIRARYWKRAATLDPFTEACQSATGQLNYDISGAMRLMHCRAPEDNPQRRFGAIRVAADQLEKALIQKLQGTVDLHAAQELKGAPYAVESEYFCLNNLAPHLLNTVRALRAQTQELEATCLKNRALAFGKVYTATIATIGSNDRKQSGPVFGADGTNLIRREFPNKVAPASSHPFKDRGIPKGKPVLDAHGTNLITLVLPAANTKS